MHRSIDRQNENHLQHAVFPAGRVAPTTAAMRLVFIFAAGILAFPTPSFSTDACGESADTATMLSCINDELSAVDAELNLLYSELVSRLQHWDRTTASGSIGFETRLRMSQRVAHFPRCGMCIPGSLDGRGQRAAASRERLPFRVDQGTQCASARTSRHILSGWPDLG